MCTTKSPVANRLSITQASIHLPVKSESELGHKTGNELSNYSLPRQCKSS